MSDGPLPVDVYIRVGRAWAHAPKREPRVLLTHTPDIEWGPEPERTTSRGPNRPLCYCYMCLARRSGLRRDAAWPGDKEMLSLGVSYEPKLRVNGPAKLASRLSVKPEAEPVIEVKPVCAHGAGRPSATFIFYQLKKISIRGGSAVDTAYYCTVCDKRFKYRFKWTTSGIKFSACGVKPGLPLRESITEPGCALFKLTRFQVTDW